jgi:hypothetical protein
MDIPKINKTKNKIKDVREAGLDKFYTNESIAKKCINTLGTKYNWDLWDLVIEPSAGNGSFLKQLPTKKCIGIDIEPEHVGIIKQDFLLYKLPPTKIPLNNILVIGNPPFGKVSSIAIKFFNHSAEFATVIAFIIPKTFRRVSVQNKLHLNFHLFVDEDIPQYPCSFNPPMMVKCCFQIWIKKEEAREIIKLETFHNDWDFLPFGPLDLKGQPTPPKGANFAIRAYGGKCGEIVQSSLDELRPKSWHWIKIKKHISLKILVDRFSKLDYSLSLDTARQNSLGRGELVRLYSEEYD